MSTEEAIFVTQLTATDLVVLGIVGRNYGCTFRRRGLHKISSVHLQFRVLGEFYKTFFHSWSKNVDYVGNGLTAKCRHCMLLV